MSRVISFINDLGIIPNEDIELENDPNLMQGQKYMEYNRIYYEDVKPYLNGFEGFENRDNSSEATNEKDFYKTLAEYSSNYKNIIENWLKPQDANINNKKESHKQSLEDLNKLNIKLIKQANKISKDFDNIVVSDDELKTKLYKQKRILDEYIYKLQNEQYIINSNIISSSNKINKKNIYLEKYLYFIGFIFFIVIFIFIFRILFNSYIILYIFLFLATIFFSIFIFFNYYK